MASKQYEITRKQSLIDACIQVYGTSKLLFQFAKDNGLQIDSVVNIGDRLTYDDSLGVPKMKKKLTRNADIVHNNVKPAEFNNWFLPARDTLNKMYVNLHLFGVGDFVLENYECSTEPNSTNQWLLNFLNGSETQGAKADLYNVRACRSFNTGVGQYNLRDIGPAGGLIFYIDGGTYYEAAPADQSAAQIWSNIINILIGTTGTIIGTGEANTDAITAQPGHVSSAAKLCKDLVIEN